MGRNKFHGSILANVAEMAHKTNGLDLNITVKVEATVSNPKMRPRKHRTRINKKAAIAASCDWEAGYCTYGHAIQEHTIASTETTIKVFGKEIVVSKTELEEHKTLFRK